MTMNRPRGMSVREVILYHAREDSNGCWKWQSTIATTGYAVTCFNGKARLVHRLSYKEFRGPINSKLQIDHICRVRDCVSPFHLRLITLKENVLCGVGITAVNKTKTFCCNGHEFTKENTYRKPNTNHRNCRKCLRATRLRYDARQKAMP